MTWLWALVVFSFGLIVGMGYCIFLDWWFDGGRDD